MLVTQPNNGLLTQPREILLIIASYLPASASINLARTCSSFKNITKTFTFIQEDQIRRYPLWILLKYFPRLTSTFNIYITFVNTD